ncbi:hypothetical protein Btru_025405 [Bulinus truncatus]|nr:hypothetical protein Btru_025405 [Bulinus truncatus]
MLWLLTRLNQYVVAPSKPRLNQRVVASTNKYQSWLRHPRLTGSSSTQLDRNVPRNGPINNKTAKEKEIWKALQFHQSEWSFFWKAGSPSLGWTALDRMKYRGELGPSRPPVK